MLCLTSQWLQAAGERTHHLRHCDRRELVPPRALTKPQPPPLPPQPLGLPSPLAGSSRPLPVSRCVSQRRAPGRSPQCVSAWLSAPSTVRHPAGRGGSAWPWSGSASPCRHQGRCPVLPKPLPFLSPSAPGQRAPCTQCCVNMTGPRLIHHLTISQPILRAVWVPSR